MQAHRCNTASLEVLSERFLTPKEAARFLGSLHPRTITRFAREGYLPAYPIGEGRRVLWRFRRGDLEAWMIARRSRQVHYTSATGAPIGGFHND